MDLRLSLSRDPVEQFVDLGAPPDGFVVETVPPHYTSPRCSHVDCSFTHEDNRDGDEFCCLKCNREYRADYDAAKNVARKPLQNWHRSGAGVATSQLTLKSGTLNVNGIYTPTLVVRTGVHRQAPAFTPGSVTQAIW